MKDDTFFLFSMTYANGEVDEFYRKLVYIQGEEHLLFICVSRESDGRTELYFFETYEDVLQFVQDISDLDFVLEHYGKEAQL